MELDRIVCLANSYKHDNRCVAGISLITKQWKRLVADASSGALTRERTCCPGHGDTAVLDVIEAEVGEACPSRYHPEDVFVTKRPWKFVRRFDNEADARFLSSFLQSQPTVLERYCDRILAQTFNKRPARVSLGLIRPDDLWWWIREEDGKRRNRANFRLGRTGRIRYDLPVTDPEGLSQLNLLPAGMYPNNFVCGDKRSSVLLTVSLTEPFESFHYKLVAGVVTFPS